MDGDASALVERAETAFESAHVPYSEYPVGAALETASGEVFVGCNVENANYSNSLHAEEVAVGEAVKRGHTEFTRLAVASAARDGVTPCGMCRQTLAEFADERGDRRVHARRTAPRGDQRGDTLRQRSGERRDVVSATGDER